MPDLFFYRDPEDEEEERALAAADAQTVGFFESGKEECTTGKGELEDLFSLHSKLFLVPVEVEDSPVTAAAPAPTPQPQVSENLIKIFS